MHDGIAAFALTAMTINKFAVHIAIAIVHTAEFSQLVCRSVNVPLTFQVHS